MLKERGFTLLEVLLATVIISVGVIALVWAFSAGLSATTDIENMDLALNIAQAKMEVIKPTSLASFTSLASSAFADDTNFPRFSTAVDVTTPVSNQRQVVVTVKWNVKGGSTSITLTTLVTKPCVLSAAKCPS